ncbi:hypothetical protein ACROYT_G033771 [Oculina patagonica]
MVVARVKSLARQRARLTKRIRQFPNEGATARPPSEEAEVKEVEEGMKRTYVLNCDQREEENNKAPHGQTEENDVQAADADHDQQEAPGSGNVVTEDMRPNNDLLENKDPEVSKKEIDYDNRVKI